jgi:type I restriction-modification system DNA methylase subunit
MKTRISLNEASQLLGVSKETLRNWDRAGKLSSKRNPANNYRTYGLDDVLRLKEDSPIVAVSKKPATDEQAAPQRSCGMTEEMFKRHLARLHRSLRDAHGDSSLISRFDEITKLLFAKALSEKTPKQESLFTQLLEENANYAARIRAFYEQACAKNSALVPQRFRKLNLPDEAIVAAGQVLSSLQLTGASVDIKGVAYEEVVRNTFDKGDNQQFFTPREIAAFLVAMLGEETRGAVCDPASGTGGFLVEMLRQGAEVASFTALEVDERLAWVTGINLFLTGATEFQSVYLGNGGTLGAKADPYLGEFQVIITNPPFGSDYSDAASLQKYELGRSFTSRRRGILFIERCIDMLKPGGVLGMVIDQGVLSLSSTQDVREFIQRRAELLAVISLPETAFMPYASVNTSIIILRKAKKPTRGLTFFAKSERVGRKPNGEPDTSYDESGNAVPNSDLDEILAAWREFQTHGKTVADPERVFLANPFADAKENPELRLDFRYHHPARLMAAAAIQQSKHPVVSLGEICIERNETYVPSVDFPDQFIYYTGLAQMESRTGNATQVYVPAQSLKSGVKKFEQHDILFARMRPNLRKCHFAEFTHDGYTSSECIVLTVRSGADGAPMFDPFLLSVLLRSDFVYGQIMHQVAGIGRPRLASKDFKHILVPVPPQKIQATMKESFLKARDLYKGLEAEALQLIHQAEAMKIQSIENIARSLCGVSISYRAS